MHKLSTDISPLTNVHSFGIPQLTKQDRFICNTPRHQSHCGIVGGHVPISTTGSMCAFYLYVINWLAGSGLEAQPSASLFANQWTCISDLSIALCVLKKYDFGTNMHEVSNFG
jgi:hypothetical protein